MMRSQARLLFWRKRTNPPKGQDDAKDIAARAESRFNVFILGRVPTTHRRYSWDLHCLDS